MSRAVLLLLAAAATAPVHAGAQPLRGWVVTADDRPVAGLWARVRWSGIQGAHADSVALDPEGRFRLPLPPGAPDTVELWVDARDPAARRYHPARVRVPRAELGREQGIVLLPLAWTPAAGRFAGTAVPVSPRLARTPPCPGCGAFWPRLDAEGTARFQLWPRLRFPLRVAFDRAHSVPAGSAPDSAAFWAAADEVGRAFGEALFRPAPFERSLPRWDRPGPDDMVLVVVDASLAVAGLTTLLGRSGAVEHAELRLQRPRSVLDASGAELVAHELMHVLGMGHTCAWRSVAADLRRCPGMRAPLPTAEDVAYTQLLYRVRELQAGRGARWGADAAVVGEPGEGP